MKVSIVNRDGEPVVSELDEEFEGFTGRTNGAKSSINLSYFSNPDCDASSNGNVASLRLVVKCENMTYFHTSFLHVAH